MTSLHVLKIRKLLLFLFAFQAIHSYAQEVDLSQFYTSRYEPIELNMSSEERIKLLYEDYRATHDEKTRVDEKQFVYEYNYQLDRLNRSGSIFYGDSIGAYLNELKDFIIDDEFTRRRVKVYLTNFPYLNAFTNDFGNIYVNVATLAKIDSEGELLYMLAHEIGHVLLRHSYKKEENELLNARNWRRNEELSNFERHSFSREHELQADSIALELLKNKIPVEYAKRLIIKINSSSNPVFSEPVDLGLLTANHNHCHHFLDSLWNASLNDTLFFKVDDDDSLSTHPSSSSRKAYVDELTEGFIEDSISYTPSSKFAVMQELARYLLLDAYLEAGMYLEALDHALKLRAQRGDEKFLVPRQIKALTALVQNKYYGGEYDRILNEMGNSLTDENYLRLRKIYLQLSPLDFNIIAHNAIDELAKITNSSEGIQNAAQKTYQFLYKGYPDIFEEDSLGKAWVYQPYSDSLEISYTPEDSETDSSEDLLNDAKDEGYVFVEPMDSSYLVENLLENSQIDSALISYIQDYEKSLTDTTYSVSPYEMSSVFIAPHRASSYFHRGRFVQSSKFDPNAPTALIQSDNLYFNSKHKKKYRLNYEKSLKLETSMTELHLQYPQYDFDFSNRPNAEAIDGVTVFDNYLHRIIKSWMSDILIDKDLVYSPVSDQVKKYVYDKGVSYLVYRICIVSRNRGRGKKHYLNYYEIYFDMENDGIAYLTKIASKMPPDKFQLEQLIYLSSENKKVND